MKILFVCTGNICRSPLAEAIFRDKMKKYGIPGETDSAGFEPFHAGDPADPRAVQTARKRNIDLTHHVARLFKVADFDEYDLIFVMDDSHYENVRRMSRDEKDMKKVDYLMNIVYPGENMIVPDPWYDGMREFEKVFEQLDHALEILARELAKK